jgi:hypothetical protein
VDALSNLYNAAKLEWQRAFMQKYWTETNAASKDSLDSAFGDKADNLMVFLSDLIWRIGGVELYGNLVFCTKNRS